MTITLNQIIFKKNSKRNLKEESSEENDLKKESTVKQLI